MQTVVTGSQSDVNMELKYPLVYTNNMFAQRQLIQTLLTMFYTQNQFITINMHIKAKQNYKVTYEDASSSIHFVNYLSLPCW